MQLLGKITIFASLATSAALFGFFYAWVCSTMWGLDAIDPRVAITAMQGMNASVLNGIFAVSFFGTAPLLAVATVLAFVNRRRGVAAILGFALVVTVVAVNALTMTIHVPMNETLAALGDAFALSDPAQVWADYSPRWQFWNQVRTATSGSACLLVGWAIYRQGQAG